MDAETNVTQIAEYRNPGYYIFYNEMAEFPWTVVWLKPSMKKGKKWYMVGGVSLVNAKVGFFPYRLDRKNAHLLGQRIKDEDELPRQVKLFLEQAIDGEVPE
jgi:hypothetical protein